MKRIVFIAKGKVQGVYYRDHCRQAALKLGVTGYVRNLDDGSVKIIAEGDADQLKEYERQCKRGSMMAFVQTIEGQEEEATGEFTGFDIR